MTILYSGSMLYGHLRPAQRQICRPARAHQHAACGAFRGHGTVDVRFAFESLLDEMAGELKLDPFALRRANLLSAPTFTENDMMVNTMACPSVSTGSSAKAVGERARASCEGQWARAKGWAWRARIISAALPSR